MQYVLVSSAYGCGAYNSSTYNGATGACNTGSGSTGSSSAGGSNGVLTDTGIVLAAAVTIACLIILISVIVKIWKRPGKKISNQ